MPRDAYFTVQQIYRGWALFGIVLLGALAANLGLAVALRHKPDAASPALIGAIFLAATLAVFFTWTYPANQLTNNWTFVPANWAALRRQWEYSHAVNAVLTFLALCAVALAALKARE